jgi:N-acetylglucosamine kinase-like BadF-type ATPase
MNSSEERPLPRAPTNEQFRRTPTFACTDESLILGVDGGGTKTVAVLAVRRPDEAPLAVGRGMAGPSNPRAYGLAIAQQNIAGAVREAFETAGRQRAPVAALCLAVAGAGHASIREAMYRWCEQQALADRWRVVHDAEIILRAGVHAGPGIALISGTGSLAFGTAASGRSARAGGWGHLLGDEGSGYAIGLDALRAVAQATDRRGPETRLTCMLLEHLGLRDPWELIPTLHAEQNVRHRIAAAAPVVLQAAADGDLVALRIREQAAQNLSSMTIAVARSLDFGCREYQLAFSGGVFQHHAALRDAVLRYLDQHQLTPRAMAVVHEPVDGALLLAQDMLT